MDDDFLDSHCEEFILFVEDQGGVSIQIPTRDVWNLCLLDQQHTCFNDAWSHSCSNDARFCDKITGLLRRYSGNLIDFYEWERNKSVDMKSYVKDVEEKVPGEKIDSGMGSMLKSAVKHGAEAAIVDQASDLLLDAFRGVFEGNDAVSAALENDMGREAAKLLTALAVFYVGHSYPEMVPQSEHIKRICETIVENSTRNIIAPNLVALIEQLGQLSKLGDAVPNVLIDESEEVSLGETEEAEAKVGRFREG